MYHTSFISVLHQECGIKIEEHVSGFDREGFICMLVWLLFISAPGEIPQQKIGGSISLNPNESLFFSQ